MEKDPVRVQNVTCGLTNGQLLLCSINVLYEYKPKKTRIQRRSSSDWKHCLFLFRGVGHSCHFYFRMFYYSFRYGITWVLCFGCTVSQHRNIKIKLTVFTASRKTKGPSLIPLWCIHWDRLFICFLCRNYEWKHTRHASKSKHAWGRCTQTSCVKGNAWTAHFHGSGGTEVREQTHCAHCVPLCVGDSDFKPWFTGFLEFQWKYMFMFSIVKEIKQNY